MLKNHHAFESKVQEAQVAQVNQVARERPEGLRVAHRTAHAAKDHAAKGADLKAVRRTALQAARAPKDHGAKDADLKAALRAKVHGAKGAGLKAVLRAKDHAAKGADLKAARRTALQEALALKDHAA